MLNISCDYKWRRFWINGQEVDIWNAQSVQLLDLQFDWGVRNSGAHQLALGILFALTGDREWALANGSALLDQWVSKLEQGKFTAWSKLDEWVVNHGGKIKERYITPVV